MIQSETSKIRALVTPFTSGCGIDIGYGGDSVSRSTINIDLPAPYTRLGDYPLHLRGDGCDLVWFRDGVLDYVYSSHLLEDFEDMETILTEWLRVIKPRGRLILCMPDEQKYRAHCKKIGEDPNEHHTHDTLDMGQVLAMLDGLEIELSKEVGYSFVIVAKTKE